MRKKHPRLTEQIYESYIEKYLLNPPPKMDQMEVMYFEAQFAGIMKNLTRDFTEEQFVNFYQNPLQFINITYGMFGLTRKLNYILFQFNTARISFLQQRGINPKFEINDFFQPHIFQDDFWSFKVTKNR
jgi:hypothetical protein